MAASRSEYDPPPDALRASQSVVVQAVGTDRESVFKPIVSFSGFPRRFHHADVLTSGSHDSTHSQEASAHSSSGDRPAKTDTMAVDGFFERFFPTTGNFDITGQVEALLQRQGSDVRTSSSGATADSGCESTSSGRRVQSLDVADSRSAEARFVGKSLWREASFHPDAKIPLRAASLATFTVFRICRLFSPLECLVQSLSGARVKYCTLANARKMAVVWMNKNLKSLSYNVDGETHSASVVEIESLKTHDRMLKIKCRDPSNPDGRRLVFIFATRDACEIFVTALALLAPIEALVKDNGAEIKYRQFYNPMKDTYNRKPVAEKKKFGPYVLLKGIGRGAFGKVYVALHVKERRIYAVKAVKKMTKLDMAAAGQAFGESFVLKSSGTSDRETRIMSRIQNHKNIVTMKEIVEDPIRRRVLLVVELMPSGALMSMENPVPLQLDLAKKVFKDCVSGLQFLHQHNIVHRDIKPENILAQPDGTCKLSDFGTSKVYEMDDPDTFIGQETAVGTPAFCSPEHCLSRAAPKYEGNSFPSDIWALGVTLYFMIYGVLPFEAPGVFETYDAICTNTLKFPDVPAIPNSMKELLVATMQRNPLKRPTAKELGTSTWLLSEDAVVVGVSSPMERSLISKRGAAKQLSASAASRGVKASPSPAGSSVTSSLSSGTLAHSRTSNWNGKGEERYQSRYAEYM
ncbi:hypothetical protein NDN08_000589 [Rhodosorus marinus]|uniref:Protein kinase domain-containing protein n=1 Tax=Rhodosorus marinus TaxID=101924 RepID=A0AAV8UNE6_9RHOD|nr:hypothetical protein NDN08_000589 [Rhodosorus marinus]